MRPAELTLYHVRIGLKKPIRHASAQRTESDNLVVRCRLEDGTVGYGEGVPRPYVTGETVEGAIAQIRETEWRGQVPAVRSFAEAVAVCGRLALRPAAGDGRAIVGNAARCAVELSLLDAFGRSFGQPVSAAGRFVAGAEPIVGDPRPVRYSGAITAETPRKERRAAIVMRLWGFTQCKVKVGVAGQDDPPRLRRIRWIVGRRMDLRIDANEAWTADAAAERILRLEPFGITAVEQPVPHGAVRALASIRGAIHTPIMLDESLCGPCDARAAIEDRTCDLFNLRLSKCGGYVRSLELAVMARAAGLGYALGCHPGETGILSAAGRHWASATRGIRYLEGSYDRHVVREPLTREDLTFGYGGRAPALPGPGLGITIDPEALRRVTVRQETVCWGC